MITQIQIFSLAKWQQGMHAVMKFIYAKSNKSKIFPVDFSAGAINAGPCTLKPASPLNYQIRKLTL